MTTLKKGLDKVLATISVTLFAMLVLVVVWQVFSRQVVGNPSTWSEELARQTFVWLGLFAAAYVFGERGHIAVEFVVRLFPERVERVIAMAVQVLIIVFAVVVLIWGGWRAAMGAMGQNLSALPFTIGQMYLALPISGVFVAFYAIYHLQGIARGTEPAYAGIEGADEEAV